MIIDNRKKSVSKNVCIVALILVVILLLGASMAFQTFTLVEWWKPMAACVPIAVLLTLSFARLIKKASRRTSVFLNYALCFVLSFSILLSAFYFFNYQFTDPSVSLEYSVPVVRKFSEERTRAKGSGRRGHGVEKYNVHFIEIELSDGHTKKLEKPLREYLRIKVGDKIKIREEKGLFGINVIKMNHNQSNSNNKSK